MRSVMTSRDPRFTRAAGAVTFSPMPLPRLLTAAILCVAGSALAANYPENRAPLRPVPYLPLPLGSVKAQGWLLTQLELQRDGLTGHLPKILPDVGPNSGWLGGDGEDWEKGPYYIKGLLPLAYTLDDAKLKRDAQKWIEWSLGSQREDGFFGPKKNDDWWPRMVMTHILREYADATGDRRVEPFLEKYYAHMLQALPGRPLKDWGRSRAGDEIETVFWLYNRTGNKSLLDVAKRLHEQAYPWTKIFTDNQFLAYGGDFQPKHNVNVPQALKMPALWFQVSGDKADEQAIPAGFKNLERDHGLALGMSSGTEMLAGRSTTEGIETCSIVEQMLSEEVAIRILATPALGDHLELLAFNALPAALTKDIRQQVYYSLPNNVRANIGGKGFLQDYGNGTTPAAPSGFPCCIYNFHMGWPKFTQNSWAATADGGLAVIAYAPTTVTAKVGAGVKATIAEKTNYPFDDRIQFDVSVSQPTTFPLDLRIPAWCAAPAIAVNGQPVAGVKPGTFFRLARTWKPGDRVEVRFPMTVQLARGMNDSVSVHRGPLLYSLRIPEQWSVVEKKPGGFDTLAVETTAPWNYGLVLGSNPAAAFQFQPAPMPKNPFEPKTTPARLKARARQVPGWGVAWNRQVAFDPPVSPVESTEPEQDIELVPAGAQMLRVVNFPWIGRPPVPARDLKPDFTKEGLSRWTPYGGGWLVKDGALTATANPGGGGGCKVVATQTDFQNLVYEADVTAAPGGDAGLIFRAAKPGIGADALLGYYVGIEPNAKRVIVGKIDGQWHELASAPSAIEPDKAHHLRVVANGPKIEVYLDGAAQPLVRVRDETFKSGAIGVRDYYADSDKRSASFANIQAKSL